MPKGIQVVRLDEVTPVRAEQRFRYNIITRQQHGSERMSFHMIVVDPGRSGTTKYDMDEIVYVLEGKLTLSWDGQTVDLLPGMVAFIPAGQEFGFRYGDEGLTTRVIAVYSPAQL